MENTAMRLLAIFMFCALFSVKTSNAMYDQPSEETEISAEESLTGQTTSDEEVSPEYGYDLDAPTEGTEEVALPEEETAVEVADITVGEDKATTSVKSTRKARTGAPQKIAPVQRPSKGTKVKRERSIATKKTVTTSRSARKVAKRKESEIEKLAKFDKESGDIESFNAAVDGLISFMDSKEILSPAEKSDMYKALSDLKSSLINENMSTDAHYDAVVKILKAAVVKEKLFSKRQIRLFNSWLKSVEEEKVDPTKRKKVISKKKSKKVTKPSRKGAKPTQKIK